MQSDRIDTDKPGDPARSAPRVSVVMPSHNSGKYIAEAITSITTQTFSDLEVIVIDGDSTDATRAIVEEIAARDSRVRLVRQAHTGIVDGRNRGAALARGEYLAWLDADDVALPCRLRYQVQFLDAHPDVAAVGGTIVVTDAHLRARLRVTYPLESAQIASVLPEANVLATSATTLRLAAFHAVGGCRPAFRQGAEDYDLWLRLAERHQLRNLPEVLAYYRQHPNQSSTPGVERFILPTVAAQLSARARRSGRPDPFGDVDRFTYEWFVAMEPSRSAIDQLVLHASAGQATYLALIDQPETAQALLDWAFSITAETDIARPTRARVRLAEGITAWKSQRRPAAIAALLQAAALDPLRFGRMLLRGASARVRLG